MRSTTRTTIAGGAALGLVSILLVGAGSPVWADAVPARAGAADAIAADAVPVRTGSSAGPTVVAHQSAAEALATDLAGIAEARGWTVAQVRAEHEMVRRLDPLQREVASRLPDAFVGAVLSDRPGGPPTFLIKGTAPAWVGDLISGSGVDVDVVDRQPYSFRELEQRSTAVHQRLREMGFRYIVTSADITSGKVEATVTRDAAASRGAGASGGAAVPLPPAVAAAVLPATADAVVDALPAGLRSDLDVHIGDRPAVARQTALFGGMATTRPGRNLLCTTGFAVSPGGFVGVTTAAHCNNTEAVHDGQRHALNLFDEHIGEFGDVEWSTTSGGVPVEPRFFASPVLVRDVTAVRPVSSMRVGEGVCVYGRSTNVPDCSDIRDVSIAVTDDLGTSDRQVLMADNITQSGDSGAPWFNLTTAYGSHTGSVVVDGQSGSIFSPADLFDEALGVTVMTS